jgi:hypothetical protein
MECWLVREKPVMVMVAELLEKVRPRLSPEATLARYPKMANQPVRAKDSPQPQAILAPEVAWQLDRLALAFFSPTQR